MLYVEPSLTATSSLPSPLKSAITIEEALGPAVNWRGAWNVSSALPNSTVTPMLASMMSSLPSPLMSATAMPLPPPPTFDPMNDTAAAARDVIARKMIVSARWTATLDKVGAVVCEVEIRITWSPVMRTDRARYYPI